MSWWTTIKRWNIKKRTHRSNTRVDRFIKDIEAVYKKHGLSIGHEDSEGAFIVREVSDSDIEWMRYAHDGTTVSEEGVTP